MNRIAPAQETDSQDVFYDEDVSSENTFLIFFVNDDCWAIRTSFVQEIMYAAKIHPLPFVPSYIEGVVNCRGFPYTVVNTLKMANSSKPGDGASIDGGTVLVFKRDDDNFAIHISNIELFFEPEEQDIKLDGIRYKGELIKFFDVDIVEERLRRDLSEKDD